MNQPSYSFGAITKRPTAFLPFAMSCVALAAVLLHVARYGVLHEADEGTTAHIWQILMASQLPILAFFLIKWLPQAPKQTLQILALQAGALAANLAAVFFLT